MATAAEEYGYHMGLAFQIVDDILDIVGAADVSMQIFEMVSVWLQQRLGLRGGGGHDPILSFFFFNNVMNEQKWIQYNS